MKYVIFVMSITFTSAVGAATQWYTAVVDRVLVDAFPTGVDSLVYGGCAALSRSRRVHSFGRVRRFVRIL